MAYPTTGIHVAFGFAGDTSQNKGGVSLRADTISSQAVTTVSTEKAPPKRKVNLPIVTIVAWADGWYAIGQNPDAGEQSTARDPLKAGASIDRYCFPGDRVAWAPV